MPRCKICGKACGSGEVSHKGCRELEALKIMNVICDEYCKNVDRARDQEELDRFCDRCKVASLLGIER